MVVTPDRVAVDVPAITGVDAAVFTVPTDAPEADGTLAWDATAMVLVTAQAGSERGIGWTYGAAAARWVVADQLAPVVVGCSALDVAGAAEAMARAVRNIGRAGGGHGDLRGGHGAVGHEGTAAWLPAGGPAGPLA